MAEAEEALKRHHKDMAERQRRIKQKQERADEADERLRVVMLQVGEAVEEHDEDEGQPRSQPLAADEARGRAERARKGLEAARTQLQDLRQRFEEQGNEEACQQINLLHVAMQNVAGEVQGAEEILAAPRAQQPAKQRTQHYAMDASGDAPPGLAKNGGWKDGDGKLGTADGKARRAVAGRIHGRREDGRKKTYEGPTPPWRATTAAAARPNDANATVGGGASSADATAAAPGLPPAPANGAALAAAAATAATGAGAAAVRFAGATSQEQEWEFLQAAADHALEQARLKFANAQVGLDTDNGALLYAHQLVLEKVGTPQSLDDVHAYERWRQALGKFIEEGAAKAHAAVAAAASAGTA